MNEVELNPLNLFDTITAPRPRCVAGPQRAATATGFLLLAGNLGGAILVLVVQVVVGNPYLALGAFALLAVPGVVVARRLPDHAGSHHDPELAGPPDATP